MNSINEDHKHGLNEVTIVGFTARREKKICLPLNQMANESQCISLVKYGNTLERYLRMLINGQRIIRQCRPDILLVDGADVIGLLTILLGFWFNIPVIVRQGGNPWRTRKELLREFRQNGQYIPYIEFRFLSVLNWITYNTADGFFVVSKELKKSFTGKVRCPECCIKIVPVSIEVDRFQNVKLEEKPLSENTNILLTVTNLNFRGKFEGVCDIVYEIEDILTNHPNTIYVIAGSGEYYGKLVSYINQYISEDSVKDRILLVGFIENVQKLYSVADVFIYLSYNDGYPNVILEAKAAGLPVISNADYGMIDQIDDGRTGFLVHTSERETAQEPLEFLLDNPDIGKQIGLNATHQVKKENSIDAIATKMQNAAKDIYNQLE